MNTENDKIEIEKSESKGTSTNQMRRSLLKMGMAAPVIVTLVNRPAWGEGRDRCSVSGFHSAAAAFNAGVELSGTDNTHHEIPNSPEHYCHPENFPDGRKGKKCSAYTKKGSNSYKKKKSRYEDDSSDRKHDDIDERKGSSEGKCFAHEATGRDTDSNETLFDCVNAFNEGSRQRRDCLTWFYLNACDGKHYIARHEDDVKNCSLKDDELLSFSDYLLLQCGGKDSGGTDVDDTPPTPPPSSNDSDKYDSDGYDKEGYDKEGRNKQGYHKDGYNDQGYDKYGYDRKGFDKSGCDKEGYDTKGFNKSGYNRAGLDKDGYNRAGYDIHGYNRQGFNAAGFNAAGYDKDGYNQKGFNAAGCNRQGKNSNGKSCSSNSNNRD